MWGVNVVEYHKWLLKKPIWQRKSHLHQKKVLFSTSRIPLAVGASCTCFCRRNSLSLHIIHSRDGSFRMAMPATSWRGTCSTSLFRPCIVCPPRWSVTSGEISSGWEGKEKKKKMQIAFSGWIREKHEKSIWGQQGSILKRFAIWTKLSLCTKSTTSANDNHQTRSKENRRKNSIYQPCCSLTLLM
jgi:hypothetical protein